jgi:WD40 repeat protein
MKTKFLIILIVLIGFVSCFNFCQAEVEIEVKETTHTVVFPLERNFRFVATVKNTDDKEEEVFLKGPEPAPKPGWINILPSGKWRIEPKNEIEIVATFEPVASREIKEEELRYDFKIEAGGKEKIIPIVVKSHRLNFKEIPGALVNVTVFDKQTGKPLKDVEIIFSLPSGMEKFKEKTDSSGNARVKIPDLSYLEKLYREYKVQDSYTGYFLEIQKEGYKPYYQEIKTLSDLKIFLEPQTEYFEYKKIAEKKTEFSIWWIKASSDFKYFVTSAGAHPNPEIKPPKEVAIYFFNERGEELWRYPINTEKAQNIDLCWGLDISSDGKYVAAGCFDGGVYLLNQKGELIKKWQARGNVRWVKFSNDGKYLAFGPTEKSGPENFALYEIPSGNLVWENFVGDWARAVDFSPSGSLVAVASSNGLLTLFDKDGKKLWQASNGGLVPFLIDFDKEGKRVAVSGKGRNLIVYDSLSGKIIWNRIIDQTPRAGPNNIGDNGEIALGTGGGVLWYFDKEGNVLWRRLYGGLGHNGTYLTKNGNYFLVGGFNPTLFDKNGTILWQLKPGEEERMYSQTEQVGGVNVVWLSEDASKMVLGFDDGRVEFYEGKLVKKEFKEEAKEIKEILEVKEKEISKIKPWAIISGIFVFIVILIAAAIWLKRRKRNV